MEDLLDEQFEHYVIEAWEEIPSYFHEQMENVVVEIEKNPSPYQLNKLKLKGGELLGLYDGVPKTAWGQAQMGVQPSKITIFQEPIQSRCQDIVSLKNLIKQVLMHEIAHYFGYTEEEMKVLDAKFRKNNTKN
jgi:predicted Zn-dependent protease with MMP-like domain